MKDKKIGVVGNGFVGGSIARGFALWTHGILLGTE